MASEHQRYVAARYPERASLIGDLCDKDPQFDKLCFRYREIGCRLLMLEHAQTPYVEAEVRDLRDERANIEREIRNRLSGANDNTVAA